MFNPLDDWRKKLLAALGELASPPAGAAETKPATVPTAAKTEAATAAERTPFPPGACPQCGSILRQPIPGGSRCAQCGLQDTTASPGGLSRKDVDNGNLPLRPFQMNPGSFVQALARIRFGSR